VSPLASFERAAVDDRALVARFLATRDEEAFRTLYRAHTPYLWSLALRLCGGREPEAEEIVQEAWIRVAARLERFAWGSALRTWMAGVLINCWRERRRKIEWTEALPDELAAEPPWPATVGRLDLERAIAGLPEGNRAVLVLFEIEGFTHEEIGDLLGIAAGTSKSRLFFARRAVRESLGGQGVAR